MPYNFFPAGGSTHWKSKKSARDAAPNTRLEKKDARHEWHSVKRVHRGTISPWANGPQESAQGAARNEQALGLGSRRTVFPKAVPPSRFSSNFAPPLHACLSNSAPQWHLWLSNGTLCSESGARAQRGNKQETDKQRLHGWEDLRAWIKGRAAAMASPKP